MSFDIEKAVIETTATSVKIDLFFNYGQTGGDTSLGDYVSSNFPTVFPGDVIMIINGINYVIPLVNHDAVGRNDDPDDALLANHLYTVSTLLSAQQVTGQEGDPTPRYQPSALVWGNPDGKVDTGVLASRTINGPFGAQIHVSLLLNDAAFATTVNNNLDFMFFNFASATCGNDVLIGIGQLDEVPEPATITMLGAGLLGLALLRRR